MNKIRAAYQGFPGAYSDEACRQIFTTDGVVPVGFRTFEEVFMAVREGTCDVAVLPFENSLGGSSCGYCNKKKVAVYTLIMTSS